MTLELLLEQRAREEEIERLRKALAQPHEKDKNA